MIMKTVHVLTCTVSDMVPQWWLYIYIPFTDYNASRRWCHIGYDNEMIIQFIGTCTCRWCHIGDYDNYTCVHMFPASYTITPSSFSSSSTGLLCWFTRSILATFTRAITIVTVAIPTTTIFITDMAMEKIIVTRKPNSILAHGHRCYFNPHKSAAIPQYVHVHVAV